MNFKKLLKPLFKTAVIDFKKFDETVVQDSDIISIIAYMA